MERKKQTLPIGVLQPTPLNGKNKPEKETINMNEFQKDY